MLFHELFVNLYNTTAPAGLRFILDHEIGRIRLHPVALWYQLAVAYSKRIKLFEPCGIPAA